MYWHHYITSAVGPVWPPSVSQLLLTAAGAWQWRWRWPHSAARSKLEKWCGVADLLNTCAGLSLDTGSAPHKGYMSPPSFWAAALLQATEERWIELLVTEEFCS